MLDRRPVRLALAIGLMVSLVACEPAPTVAPGSPGAVPSSVAPSASSMAVATSRPTVPPASPAAADPSPTTPPARPVDLPPELADVAWAAYDGQTQVLSVGLLGQHASMTRWFPDWTAVIRPAGRYVILVSNERTEVIDASDGSTFAEYPWPRNADAIHTMASNGQVIYFSRWNDDEVGAVWRMRIDGTGLVRLTDLGSRDHGYWRGGFAMQPDGSVVASTCAADGPQGTDDARCRLYVAGPEDDPDQPIRDLRNSTPPVCRLIGATAHHAVFFSTPTADSCFTDGGFTPINLVTVDLEDRSFTTIPEDHSLYKVGFVERRSDRPWVVGAKDADLLRTDVFWPYDLAVIRNLANAHLTPLGGGGPIFAADWMHWSPVRVVGDWVIVEGVGREFLLCRYGPEVPPDEPRACGPDTGGVWNVRRDQLIRLPLGTFGDEDSLSY